MDLHTLIEKYLIYCELQKGLNSKTIKAYRIDLSQFESYAKEQEDGSSKELICSYLESLHSKYKPKSIKRKLATLKAFYEYLTYEEIIEDNPFSKIHLKIKEPIIRAIMTSACIIRLSAGFMMYPVMMCAASFLRKYKNWYGTFVIA